MAIAYRASATNTTFVTGASCNKPAGTVSGDVLVAFLYFYDDPTGTVSAIPSGWSEITACRAEGGNAGAFQYAIQRAYIKVAGGSEPASYTWTLSAADTCNIGIACYSGVDNVTPQDTTGTGNSGTAANRVATGVTTVTDGAFIVVGSTGYANALTGGFGGMTNRVTWDTKSAIYDQTISPAGATGNKTATSAAETIIWLTALVALRPSGAAAATGFMTPSKYWGT